MALSANLFLRQSQSLVMTPQLMQSIQLLQMTHLELMQFIAQEVERNPLLEIAADDGVLGGDGGDAHHRQPDLAEQPVPRIALAAQHQIAAQRHRTDLPARIVLVVPAEQLGAETRRIIGNDFVEEILKLARREHATQIVIGTGRRSQVPTPA